MNREERLQIKALWFQLMELGKQEQIKQKLSRSEEGIQIREEANGTENREMIEKTNGAKC